VLPVDPQRVAETDLPWALLSADATRPEDVVPGRFLVFGGPDDALLARVVDVVSEGEDAVVHVEVLGPVAEVERALHAA
jgi:hypothetical protein